MTQQCWATAFLYFDFLCIFSCRPREPEDTKAQFPLEKNAQNVNIFLWTMTRLNRTCHALRSAFSSTVQSFSGKLRTRLSTRVWLMASWSQCCQIVTVLMHQHKGSGPGQTSWTISGRFPALTWSSFFSYWFCSFHPQHCTHYRTTVESRWRVATAAAFCNVWTSVKPFHLPSFQLVT